MMTEVTEIETNEEAPKRQKPGRPGKGHKKDGRGRRAGSRNAATIEREKQEAQVSADEEQIAKARARRKKRGLLHEDGYRERLYAPQRPGFYRRWVNDTGSRVQDLIDRGYDVVDTDKTDDDKLIVSDQEGGTKSQHVGTDDKSKPIRAVLMEQPMEFREEDVAFQNKQDRELMDQISTGRIAGGAEEDDLYYADINVGGRRFKR